MDCENPKSFTKPEQVTLPPQRRPNTQAMTPNIKMLVSDWFTNELGNKARIIKARDWNRRVYGSSQTGARLATRSRPVVKQSRAVTLAMSDNCKIYVKLRGIRTPLWVPRG
jgi:hypothetical protein